MNKSFSEIIIKRCSNNAIPLDHITIIDWNSFDISTTQKAILFVHALWSGPSHSALGFFLSTISPLIKETDLQLLFLDADNYDVKEFARIFGAVSHGWGELFWIKNGSVIHIDKGTRSSTEATAIIERARSL